MESVSGKVLASPKIGEDIRGRAYHSPGPTKLGYYCIIVIEGSLYSLMYKNVLTFFGSRNTYSLLCRGSVGSLYHNNNHERRIIVSVFFLCLLHDAVSTTYDLGFCKTILTNYFILMPI